MYIYIYTYIYIYICTYIYRMFILYIVMYVICDVHDVCSTGIQCSVCMYAVHTCQHVSLKTCGVFGHTCLLYNFQCHLGMDIMIQTCSVSTRNWL